MTATPRADLADTGTQYAGLTDMERAAASADCHMATCDAPVIADCEECRRRLSRIRTYLAAVLPEHRRAVLAEAAPLLQGLIGQALVEGVRRLAVAAPETTQGGACSHHGGIA